MPANRVRRDVGMGFLSVREQLSERRKQEPLVTEDHFAWPKQQVERQLWPILSRFP